MVTPRSQVLFTIVSNDCKLAYARFVPSKISDLLARSGIIDNYDSVLAADSDGVATYL